ncbi:glycosyltransferase [Thermodesulfobacteriota bacterium]
MKRILIICCTFPPSSYVGGLRPAMFAKYLPEFGWEPTILTRDWPDGDPRADRKLDLPWASNKFPVHRVLISTAQEQQSLMARTLFEFCRDFFCPDYAYPPGNLERMVKYAISNDLGGPFDVVLGTTPDMWPITLARRLAKHGGCPWVADFRDVAEQNKNIGGFRTWLLINRFIFRRNFLLRTAGVVLVVSRKHAEWMQNQYSGGIETIYNGYDADLFENSEPLARTEKFSIVYMGRLLNEEHRNPTLLYQACDILCERIPDFKKNLSVDFYGAEPELVNKLSSIYECRSAIKIHPRVAYQKVPDILKKSCVLLVLVNSIDKGILTTKLFEYLPIGRPILCVTGDRGEIDQFLKVMRAGKSIASIDQMVLTLENWYHQWLKDGSATSQGDMQRIRQFTRRNQTSRLAEILDMVVERR